MFSLRPKSFTSDLFSVDATIALPAPTASAKPLVQKILSIACGVFLFFISTIVISLEIEDVLLYSHKSISVISNP